MGIGQGPWKNDTNIYTVVLLIVIFILLAIFVLYGGWCLWDKVRIKETNQIGFISGFQGKSFNIKSITGVKLFSAINSIHLNLVCRNNNWIIQSLKGRDMIERLFSFQNYR